MSDFSWLNPTPHAIAVYASQPLSPVATQHSLPSGRYSLTWAARFGHHTVRTAGRHPLARRQRGQLNAATGEETIRGDEEGIVPIACDRGEGCVDFADGAGIEDLNLQSERASRCRYFP